MKIIYFLIALVLITSCAKPTIIEAKKLNDSKLDCEEIDLQIFEAQKFKADAEKVNTGASGNVTRLILFWPAWLKSINNAEKAIKAADDRVYHLSVLKRKKKCANLSNSGLKTINSIAEELKELKKMYESGVISNYEYEKAKKKILN